MRAERIAIILPWRIGDTFLSLPLLMALKQLQEASQQTGQYEYTVYVIPTLLNLVKALGLFEAKVLTRKEKLLSWIRPYDKAFFLSTTSKDIGLRARETYGEHLKNKKYCRFTHNMMCYCLDAADVVLPKELVEGLKQQFSLSTATYRCFGSCLSLGYEAPEILEAFQMASLKALVPFSQIQAADLDHTLQSPYLVCCVEAGYGLKSAPARSWAPEHYFTVAEKAYHAYGLPTYFIGALDQPDLPDAPYCVDLRQALNLDQVAKLLSGAVGYYGNDSGIMHLANFVQAKTVCIYRSTTPEMYGPIFPENNTPVQNPDSVASVWQALRPIIEAKLPLSQATA